MNNMNYDPAEVLSNLIDDVNYEKLCGLLPQSITEEELAAVNDEITHHVEVNAAAILALPPLDEERCAGSVNICFFTTIGGEKCKVSAEFTNTGDHDTASINANVGIERVMMP